MRKYHSMTLEEIKIRFYIVYDGEEDIAIVKKINGTLSRKWQEVANLHSDTKRHIFEIKDELRRIDGQLKYNREEIKQRYIMENRSLTRDKKWTDAAREACSYVESFTPELRTKVDRLHKELSEWEEERAIWNEVKDNLKYIAERVDTGSMNTAVEARMSNKEPTNVPVFDKDPDESISHPEKSDNKLF